MHSIRTKVAVTLILFLPSWTHFQRREFKLKCFDPVFQQSHHHSSRSTTATPILDIDAQSDAGSERSVTSPFVPQQSMTSSVVANQHPAHHQQFPYHVHHTLIQHLNEMREMRDLRDWYGHLPSGTGGGSGNNHWKFQERVPCHLIS